MALPGWAKQRDESEVRLEVEDFVDATDDTEWLRSLERRTRNRMAEIGSQRRAAAVKQKWEEVQTWRPGTRIWCCANGIFLGGHIQRSDEFVVSAVQKRQRVLWIRRATSKKKFELWVRPEAVHTYGLRTSPPEQPRPSPGERRMLQRLGDELSRAIAGETGGDKRMRSG